MTRLMLNTLYLTVTVSMTLPGATASQGRANPIHPQFQLLDDAGRPVRESRAEVSDGKTCGACHNTEFINSHNVHFTSAVKASCAACHFEGGKIEWTSDSFEPNGLLKRSWIRISEPRNENCASCHGLVHTDQAPLRLPGDFSSVSDQAAWGAVFSGQAYDLSRLTGAVISAQNLSDSFLNLAGKSERSYPWDAHARRLVECTHCHFAANNPERAIAKAGTPSFLKNDPRRLQLREYLRTPDHRLVSADCRDCHDPLQAHAFLPYKERHMQALSCQSCHIPRLMGPAEQAVDDTVVHETGGPRIEYRGTSAPGGYSGVVYTGGYQPFLFPVRKGEGPLRLQPFNLVTHWRWISGQSKEAVAADLVRRAYLKDGRYRHEVLQVLDSDGNGQIGETELILNSPDKIRIIRTNLESLGVSAPEIAAGIDVYPVNHGVLRGESTNVECSNCHAGRSRLNAGILLATRAPAAALPEISKVSFLSGAGTVRHDDQGRLLLDRSQAAQPFYVFGHSAAAWSDGIGFIVFFLVILAAAVHGAYRMYCSRRYPKAADLPRQRAYLFTNYERVWHWTMAASVLALLLTGFRIHYSGFNWWLPLPDAVRVHNFFAVVLAVNAFLALFHHLAGNAIRQFLPPARGLDRKVRTQARYYLSGIFRGHPHPEGKTPERKLNVLQQITYLLLLNVLFPMQIVSGVLIWGIARWPDFAASIGGLTLIAPLHQLGAWLFLSFFVLHVYLTTTGHTVLSNVKAMIDGYDEIAVPAGVLGEES